jgi:hypothetical protein
MQRVVEGCDHLFQPLEDVISQTFLPTLFGSEVSARERNLYSLPTRKGGLGVRKPTLTSRRNYETSRLATAIVSQAITGKATYNSQQHRQQIREATTQMKRMQTADDEALLETIISEMSDVQRRAVKRIGEERTSAWLTVLPLAQHHFDLSEMEFRDALALRYHKPLLRAPAFCDGCSEPFSVRHALKCKKGGLIILRHNEIRDAVGDLASLVWKGVSKEPIVQEANDTMGKPALVADLSIRGVWQPQAVALLDVRVIDTDAQSYVARPVREVLMSAESAKKRKYVEASTERRASFTPFVSSVDGALGGEAHTFLKLLAERLSFKWGRNHSEVTNWVRTRLNFATIRATCQCIRGTRYKWRSLGMEDGAALHIADLPLS